VDSRPITIDGASATVISPAPIRKPPDPSMPNYASLSRTIVLFRCLVEEKFLTPPASFALRVIAPEGTVVARAPHPRWRRAM